MKARASDPVGRTRAIAMALPEAVEKETWEAPTFRVRDRIFAMMRFETPPGAAIWVKAPPGVQEMLVDAMPERFFRPPYLGPKGWLGVVLETADWEDVAHHIRRSYGLVAPRKLARLAVQETE